MLLLNLRLHMAAAWLPCIGAGARVCSAVHLPTAPLPLHWPHSPEPCVAITSAPELRLHIVQLSADIIKPPLQHQVLLPAR